MRQNKSKCVKMRAHAENASKCARTPKMRRSFGLTGLQASLSLCLPRSDHSSHGGTVNRFESCEGRRPTVATNSWRFRRIASSFSFGNALWSHPSRPARRRTNNVHWPFGLPTHHPVHRATNRAARLALQLLLRIAYSFFVSPQAIEL